MRSGITMRLLSETKIDKNIPKVLAGKNNVLPVAFNLDNYGKHWYLLSDNTEYEEEEESDKSETGLESETTCSSNDEKDERGDGNPETSSSDDEEI